MRTEEILDMLDWHMSPQTQSKGISLAKESKEIIPFIQPLTPRHNKNVWKNCAAIIADKTDEQLKPYLIDLLEWLQDMNWPGSLLILDRLKKYSDNTSICKAVKLCVKKAKDLHDDVWESNLYLIL